MARHAEIINVYVRRPVGSWYPSPQKCELCRGKAEYIGECKDGSALFLCESHADKARERKQQEEGMK